MAFDQYARSTNEKKKFVEADDGEPAVRSILVDGVRLSEGASFEIKDHDGNVIHKFSETLYQKFDHRGFLVFEVTDNGDVKHKGVMIKI